MLKLKRHLEEKAQDAAREGLGTKGAGCSSEEVTAKATRLVGAWPGRLRAADCRWHAAAAAHVHLAEAAFTELALHAIRGRVSHLRLRG